MLRKYYYLIRFTQVKKTINTSWSDDRKVKPLNILLPNVRIFVKSYDGQTKWMYFFFDWNDNLLKEYNTIWDKISADIKREFDSKPICNKNFLKIKVKYHGDEVTDFYDTKIPKVDSNHTCLAIIRLDTAFNKDGNCKYIEKRVIKHINDNLSNFSSSDYSDDSDEE